MSNATPQQITAIHCALHAQQLMKHKATIISGVSQGRTVSSKQLTFEEAKFLLADLNKNNTQKEDGQKMRNNIIAMAHEMGWITTKQVVTPTGLKTVNDYSNLDAWMLQYSYQKKKLFNYTYQQLPKLVTQFKAVYEGTLKAI